MNVGRWAMFAMLAVTVAAAEPAVLSGGMMQKKPGKEEGGKKQDPEGALTAMIRGIQADLDSASAHGFLSNIDSARFEDYPRFEDMVERLTRDDTLRVFFRQASNSIKEESAQTIIDAEMELVRKDAAGQIDRRRQQLVIDFELASRGWKIINITPRDFFRPL